MNRVQLKGNIDLNLSQILGFDFKNLINSDFQAKNQNELEIIAQKNIITYNQYFTNDIIKQKWQSIFY